MPTGDRERRPAVRRDTDRMNVIEATVWASAPNPGKFERRGHGTGGN
jgi:hypothetical protein